MREPEKERNFKFVDGKWYLDFTFNKKRIRQYILLFIFNRRIF